MATGSCSKFTLEVGAAALLVCALPPAAVAQATPPQPLVVAYRAPSSCPDVEALWQQIEGRTERVRRASDANAAEASEESVAGRFSIEIATQGSGFVARLAGPEGGQRRLGDASCEDLVEALGLVIALAVDPGAKTTPVLKPPRDAPAVVAPPMPPQAPPPIAPAPVPEGWRLGMAGQFGGSNVSQGSGLLAGLRLVAIDRSRSSWLRAWQIEVARSLEATANVEGTQVSLRQDVLGVHLCPVGAGARSLMAQLCVAGLGGWRALTAVRAGQVADRTDFWAAAGASVTAAANLPRLPFFVAFSGSAAVSVKRHRYVVDEILVAHEMPPLLWQMVGFLGLWLDKP